MEKLLGCWDMPEHDGLMRVFWPADIERSELPGVIVGWKNSSLDVVVVAVLNHVDVGLPAYSSRSVLMIYIAEKRRERLENGHFTPQCAAPYRAHFSTVRFLAYACPRPDKC